jgi:hypothetical protein
MRATDVGHDRHTWPGATSTRSYECHSFVAGVARHLVSRSRGSRPRSCTYRDLDLAIGCWSSPYLQGAVSDVCPGGWQRAPGSCGPLSLLPGPKLPAYAGAAEIDSAATDRTPATILRFMASSFGEVMHNLGAAKLRDFASRAYL